MAPIPDAGSLPLLFMIMKLVSADVGSCGPWMPTSEGPVGPASDRRRSLHLRPSTSDARKRSDRESLSERLTRWTTRIFLARAVSIPFSTRCSSDIFDTETAGDRLVEPCQLHHNSSHRKLAGSKYPLHAWGACNVPSTLH